MDKRMTEEEMWHAERAAHWRKQADLDNEQGLHGAAIYAEGIANYHQREMRMHAEGSKPAQDCPG